jgi:xylulokinase
VKYLLGFDIGSSSVKAALLDAESGKPAGVAFSPESEMKIVEPQPGFAEQDPDSWWLELQHAVAKLKQNVLFSGEDILAIGISYQMHGLVCVDAMGKPLRPSIIWCDSRAVDIGNKAFEDLGAEYCLTHFLNSPGNFTASKLKWVKENEPGVYQKIAKIMLPGDYIAYRLTGEICTTASGLSEGIFWDYPSGGIAKELLGYYGIDAALLPNPVPVFGYQGSLTVYAAAALGLTSGIPVSYRAGDQPNNAWSLNVLEPGEIAATAGTSGVVYGVTDKANYDAKSRVNTFIHVNHKAEKPRYGILLCVNGTGILNSWLRTNLYHGSSYASINQEAAEVEIGSEGLFFYPFGNGAERILENRESSAQMKGLQFNRHQRKHLARAAQEGIVFALKYGTEIMSAMGMQAGKVRAGYANMFLSEVFASTFANALECEVTLYNTDGAVGAARAAGLGAGIFDSPKACFNGMEVVRTIQPDPECVRATGDVYAKWKQGM